MRVSLRPNPRKGVFETMLVLDGRPVELGAHLERLNSSLRELYGRGLPPQTTETALAAAAEVQHGKLRITVTPDSAGGLKIRPATAAVDPAAVFPARDRGAALRSFPIEEGLGAHKWADRRLLDRAAATMAGTELPLLLDRDGFVLEVSRGSVFCSRQGTIATPPLDGRILPSIARHQALEVARAAGIEAHETKLSLDDLLAADEVFLSGSVRGIEPVLRIDGTALPGPGELSALVGVGLRRRWLSDPPAELAAAGAGERRAGRRER